MKTEVLTDDLVEGSAESMVDKEVAAAILSTTPRHVESLAPQIGFYRIGRFMRFRIEDLQRYLDSVRVEASGPRRGRPSGASSSRD